MKKYRQHFVYALTLWLLVAQTFALHHAMSHELEHSLDGPHKPCSICLDAAHFSNTDMAPGQVAVVPPVIKESTLSFETVSYAGLFSTPYASRAPPIIS